MRVAILHYHLAAGGVSRIIDLAVQALTEAGHEVAVIAGGEPHARSLLDRRRVAVLPGLGYSAECRDVSALAQEIDAAARDLIGGAPDIWHFHNPTLGKNPTTPQLAARWAEEGRALVLQIHDFAEQQRPANYRLLRDLGILPRLYPAHARVRYAVLNRHDSAVLSGAGLASPAAVLLNPVLPLPMESPFDPAAIDAAEYLVYPTRGIPRKNIGEALLQSVFLPADRKLVITLAPENPAHRAEHDAWEEFAKAYRLPVVFDAVTRFGRPLGDFISGAVAAITTSIGEGFGMAYLEPWQLGTPVVGRDLPKVTGDFAAEGLSMDWLYPSIPVVLDREEEAQRSALERSRRNAHALVYGIGGIACSDHESGVVDGGTADFGLLPAVLQRRVLERLIIGGSDGFHLPDLEIGRASSMIPKNQEVLALHFGLTAYAARLVKLYGEAVGAAWNDPGSSHPLFLDPTSVLAGFLKADYRF